MRSEKRVRVIAGMLLLLMVPPFLALTVIAGKFTELRDPMAADRAQVARRIAEGKGFTTDNIRPLSRSIYKETDLQSHPDLYNAPAYPALLGGVFWVLDLFGVPPMDVTVAAFGAALWVLSVWLTYLVARKWFGGGVGMLAALFYGCSAGVLMFSVEGSVAPLLTIFVLAAMWAANVGFRRKVGREEEGEEEAAGRGDDESEVEEPRHRGRTIEIADEPSEVAELSATRLFLAGLACGAAILTHYVMMVFAAAFGIYLLAGQKRKARVVGLFGLGLLVMLAPWMARNFQVAGAAWTSLWWYDSMTRTGTYPGDSVYLMASTPQGPFWYFITHPTGMLVKLLGSMAQYRTLGLRVIEPLLAILFLVALFSRGAGIHWRRTVIFSVCAWVLCVLVSGLFRVDGAVLVAWLPVAAVACAMFVKEWIEQTVGEFSYAGLRRLFTGREATESEQKRWRILWRVHLGQKASRFIVYALVAGVAFVPVLVALQGRTRGVELISGKDIAELKNFVKEEEVVLTDQPALVAWHAQRTAVGLFQKEDALLEFVRVCGEPAAIYITLAALTTMREEMGDWWKWIGTAQGMYRNWAPADPMPSRALLRLRSPELRAQREREVAPWRAAVNREPRASEPRVQLAQEYFARELLQDAFHEYVAALERDGYNLDAVRGLEQLSARLNDNVNALALAQQALTMSAEDPRGRAIIVEARLVFKKALALQPKNLWLLMQLAACEAKLKNWDEAEKYLTQAGQASGNRVPPQLLVGLLHMNRGKFAEAEREFRDLTLKQDSNQFAHLALGEALMAQGKYQDALLAFDRAQRLRPNGFRAYALAATAQVHLKQFDAAEKNFETALRLSPTLLDIRHPYAELLEMTGKLDKAIEVHEGTLVIAPDDALAMVKLANLLAQSGKDLKRALSLAQQAAAIFPTSDVVQGTLGWAFHLSGNNEKAILHLREAVRLSPSVAAYHINLGKALLAAGQKSEGRDALRAALSRQLSPETKAEVERLLASP
jgi:tetratricopeptide (TPR) repeat protein